MSTSAVDYPSAADFYRISFITYPESDGEPMAETEIHGDALVEIRSTLKRRYADAPNVQVGGNCLMYYTEGDPRRVVSPDVYAIFGVPKGPRRTLKLWEEGKAPDVVFEITSNFTKLEDIGAKKGLYAALGIREYFLYDPLSDYLDVPLQGYRLRGGEYVTMGPPPLRSEVLGLEIAIDEDRPYTLSFVDTATGEPVRSPVDQAVWEAQRADQEAQRADQEATARRAAESRVAELEAKLAAVDKP